MCDKCLYQSLAHKATVVRSTWLPQYDICLSAYDVTLDFSPMSGSLADSVTRAIFHSLESATYDSAEFCLRMEHYLR